MHWLGFAKMQSKVRYKILKIGLDELWAPLRKHSLFDDLKVNKKGN